MFGKFVLIVWATTVAANAYASSPLRGGWICKSTPEVDLTVPVKVDVHYIAIGPTSPGETGNREATGRHRIRIVADDREIMIVDGAQVGVQNDRTVYRGEAEDGYAELTIANLDQPQPEVPSLLYISKFERAVDTRFPVASLVEMLCTRTREP